MKRATLLVLFARALNLKSDWKELEQIEWTVPLSRVNAIIHAGRILDGVPMIWPQARLSPLGRWWESVKNLFRSRRRPER